jgi:hypothetical protein
MTTTPSDRDITHAEIEHYLGNLHTCMPGVVQKVYTAEGKQFVDVLPTLQRRVVNEDDEEVDEAYPLIPHVPLAFWRGGSFFVSLPIAAGDIVMLMFAERSLDTWIEQAKRGSSKPIAPGDVGMHPLDGAIALPFQPACKQGLLQGASSANLVIGVDGPTGAGQVHITPAGHVLFGGTLALEAMIRGTTHITQLTTIMTALGTLLGNLIPASGVTAGHMGTFTPLLSAFITHLNTTALSTKHKIDG